MKTPNLIEKAFLLKKTFLFADINLDNLLAIADKLDSIELSPKDSIFKQNQSPLFMYIITDGSVELVTAEATVFSELNAGDIFGHVALFKEENYSYQARVKTKSHVLALTKKHFTSIIRECPTVAIRLLENFAKQINLKCP